MVRLSCKIVIGKFVFDYATAIEITSSWDQFTTTAMIKLPHKLEFNGEPIISGEDSLFKRGDAVEIFLGYDDNLVKEFEGFVSDVNPATPMIITCEDLMWKLKQTSLTKSFREVTLKDLLSDILSGQGVDFEAVDANLGKFRITRANIVEIFEEIKKTYGLVTFAQGGKIFSGLAYLPELQEERVLDLNHDVVSSDELIFKRADDVKIKVKAISINSDNTREEVEFGDSDGNQTTFTFYNLSKQDLQETAERELEKLKFDGYRGSLVAFGSPFIKHQDVVSITDPKIPERQGRYLVKEVVTTFGVSGFRRKITLDRQV